MRMTAPGAQLGRDQSMHGDSKGAGLPATIQRGGEQGVAREATGRRPRSFGAGSLAFLGRLPVVAIAH